MKEYTLFADGACQPNPGVGGWAFILRCPDGTEIIKNGREENVTNNIMELTAVLKGLQYFIHNYSFEESIITLVLDSKYVLEGLRIWTKDWAQNDWRKKNNKPIKNVEIWKQLYNCSNKLYMKFQHIKGHPGHPENEKCDELAVKAIKTYQ